MNCRADISRSFITVYQTSSSRYSDTLEPPSQSPPYPTNVRPGPIRMKVWSSLNRPWIIFIWLNCCGRWQKVARDWAVVNEEWSCWTSDNGHHMNLRGQASQEPVFLWVCQALGFSIRHISPYHSISAYTRLMTFRAAQTRHTIDYPHVPGTKTYKDTNLNIRSVFQCSSLANLPCSFPGPRIRRKVGSVGTFERWSWSTTREMFGCFSGKGNSSVPKKFLVCMIPSFLTLGVSSKTPPS